MLDFVITREQLFMLRQQLIVLRQDERLQRVLRRVSMILRHRRIEFTDFCSVNHLPFAGVC